MKSRGKFAKFVRSMIDILNILLALSAIALAVMVFINTEDNRGLFTIIFIVGAAMNFITGIKFFMTDRKGSAIGVWIAAAVLGVLAFFTYRIVGGL